MADQPDSKLGADMKEYLETEIRKAASLPPDELRALFEPWEAQIMGALGLVQKFQWAWADWVEEHYDQITVLGEFLQKCSSFRG